MNTIKEHIKNHTFKNLYLLYGNEPYLKNLYKNTLKNAIVDPNDEMNSARYDGKDIDPYEVADMAQTLPFLSNKRLILIENSSFFKEANELSELLKNISDTTIIIFVESEIDKRSKLYKKIKNEGYIVELNTLDINHLKIFLGKILRDNKKNITEKTASYFLDKIGYDMGTIYNELNKLIAYIGERDVITNEDIDDLVPTNITNRIFEMIDAMSYKQQKKAIDLYYDLLQLKEKPMLILYLISRQFNILLQLKELNKLGYNTSDISKMVGIPSFAVSKNIKQCNNFTTKILKENLEFTIKTESDIKRGLIHESIGVDLLIVQLTNS